MAEKSTGIYECEDLYGNDLVVKTYDDGSVTEFTHHPSERAVTAVQYTKDFTERLTRTLHEDCWLSGALLEVEVPAINE